MSYTKKHPEQNTTMGDILKEAMRSRGMSQAKLAEAIGYKTQSAVAERLRGDIQASIAVKMLDLMGYDLVVRDRSGEHEWVVEKIPTPVSDDDSDGLTPDL